MEGVPALEQAIAGQIGGSYLVGFVVVAEVVDPDGTRQLRRWTSEDATDWQADGWLSAGVSDQWDED